MAYETKSKTVTVNGLYRRIPIKEARHRYLENLYQYIDERIQKKHGAKIKALEIGCGNCINIYNLINRYGDSIDITGIDISPQRIEVAKKHYGSVLDNVNFQVVSVTEGLGYDDDEFDIVYSIHCLEQIAYETRAAVKEMYRVSKELVVMVEPVFENGDVVQRLYLINYDYCRTLLKCAQELGCRIIENKPLYIQTNPSNQSTLLVLDKS